MATNKQGEHDYEVALSFAGQDRARVDRIAHILRNLGVSVFYDRFEQPQLWGKDLYQHLADIYQNKARYVMVFLSKSYVKKAWPRHELKNAQAGAFRADEEYILPIRLDKTAVPGLPETVGYLEFNKLGVDGIVHNVLRKLGRHVDETDIERAEWDGAWTNYNGSDMVSYWPPQIEKAQQESFYQVSAVLERIPWGKEPHNKRKKLGACNDCGVLPGQYHVPSCDQEWCPSCNFQALGCDCRKFARTPPPEFELE
jgi:hypothetical protein